MNNLNLKKLKNDDYDGLEFIENGPDSWYIIYSRIDSKIYPGHLDLVFEIEDYKGNLIILNNDDYVQSIDLMLLEYDDKISCLFKLRDENNFKSICVLDAGLNLVESYEYNDTKIDLQKSSFTSIGDLINRLDEYFFYDYFETF